MKNTRRRNRLEGYDYSRNGLYFITICTRDRIHYFCRINDKSVGADIIRPINELTETGILLEYSINQIENHYDDIKVLKYVIMPDHVHIIISIMHDHENADNGRMISAPTIPNVIGSLKRYVSKNSGIRLWQKSYFDHIIRSEKELTEIYNYVESNPINWVNNKLNRNKWR